MRILILVNFVYRLELNIILYRI